MAGRLWHGCQLPFGHCQCCPPVANEDRHLMDILFLLVPLSVLLALGVVGVLGWAVWAGQFEELDSEAQRILAAKPDVNVAVAKTPNKPNVQA